MTTFYGLEEFYQFTADVPSVSCVLIVFKFNYMTTYSHTISYLPFVNM
jgi:hypothetical protein